MTSDGSTLHILTPVESPHDIVERIVEKDWGTGETIVLDLSVGNLGHPSPLREHGTEYERQIDGFRWIDGQSFAATVGDTSRETYVDWVSEIADQPLSGGKSIKEWFTYRGKVSLWWYTTMSEKDFEGHPFRWMFYMFAVIGQVSSRESPTFSEVHIWSGTEYVGDALKQQFANEGVHARVHSVEGRGERWSDGRFTSEEDRSRATLLTRVADGIKKLLVRIKILGRSLLFWSSLRELRSKSPLSSGQDRPLFLIHSQSPNSLRAREVYDAVDEDVDYLDHYFGDMPFRLHRAGMNVAYLPAVTQFNHEDWIDKTDGYPLGSALPWMTVSVSQTAGLLFQQIKWLFYFYWLFGVQKVHERWTYEGIPLGRPLFEEYWELCVRGEGMMKMKEVERYRTACKALSPEAVLYRGEFYRWGRTISAGADGHTTRIGVQHGILNREHTVYQFRRRDLPVESDGPCDHVHNCPAPDRFVGFGTYVKEQFERWGGYRADRVVPIGGVRHDSLVRTFRRELSSSSLRFQLDLPEDQSVVLVCTGLSQQAGLYFDMVADGLKQTSHEAFVAVKLHHFHGGEAHVHRTAERRGIKDYSIFREHIYRLLDCADVLVAGTSTLAIEAHLLDTPVVSIVGHPNYELYPFTDEGIAQTVCTHDQMATALQRALDRPSGHVAEPGTRNPLLRRHLHNEDASACRRLAEWLRNEHAQKIRQAKKVDTDE